MATVRQRVLFVCTHNSARSQMAEAFVRQWAADTFEAFSAGTAPSQVRREAIAAMDEIGIDISNQRSKSVEEFLHQDFDWVVTVCDRARESCPVFPGAENTAHWGFDDPAAVDGDDAARLDAFRRVRDEIGQRIRLFILAGGRVDPAHHATVRLGPPAG